MIRSRSSKLKLKWKDVRLDIPDKCLEVFEDVDDGIKWPKNLRLRPRVIEEENPFPEFAWNVIIRVKLRDLSEKTIWNEGVKFLYFG